MIIVVDNLTLELVNTFRFIENAMDSEAGAPERLVYILDNGVSESTKRKIREFIRSQEAGKKIHTYLEGKGIKPKSMAEVYVDYAIDAYEDLVIVAEELHIPTSLCFEKSQN